MVTRGLFPRLGLDHCVRSEQSPELEEGLGSGCNAGIPHTVAHTSLPPWTHRVRKYTQRTLDTRS